MQQLSGQDAMFLHAELDGLPQHIGGVSIYDQSTAPGGKVRFKQILAMLEGRLHLSPIFRRKLAFVPYGLGRPYWVEDPEFDLEYHVRHIALPKPGDWRQLCILAARLHATPLRRDKPMWEIYVIEGLNNVQGFPPNCFAMLLKVHHCAMDGATGTQFMNIMHDLSPRTEDPGKAPPWVVERPSKLGMLARAYIDIWRKPGQVFDIVKQAGPALKRLRRGEEEERFHYLGDKPKTRFQGKISRHRVVEARTFDFGQIRDIKNTQPGTTVNDVMLTIVAGGLRKYLDSKGELPDNSLVTGCPIDVRSAEERSAGGNMVGFMNVSLCTDIEDPLERLAMIREEMQEARALKPVSAQEMSEMQDVLPSTAMTFATRAIGAEFGPGKRYRDNHNTVISVHPGPSRPLYLCGARLVGYTSMGALMDHLGLNHTATIYDGKVTIAPVCDRRMMPDPAFYYECLRASLESLSSAAGDAVARARSKPRYAVARKRAVSSTAATVLSE